MSDLNKCPTDDLGSEALMALRQQIRASFAAALTLCNERTEKLHVRIVAGHVIADLHRTLGALERSFDDFKPGGPMHSCLGEINTTLLGARMSPGGWSEYGGATGVAREARLSPHEHEQTAPLPRTGPCQCEHESHWHTRLGQQTRGCANVGTISAATTYGRFDLCTECVGASHMVVGGGA